MTLYRAFPLAAAVALCTLLLPASSARAQDTGTVKIAVVNPARVFVEMQETKDLKQKLESDQEKLKSEVEQRQRKVKDLKDQRDLLKPDSPQYSQANDAFMRAAIDFDTWSKITQAQLQGHQKQQMKTLFDKIVQATQKVAEQRGVDLVIADQRPELPDLTQINVEQLRAALNARNVLYSNSKVDLSQEVIATLDAQYRAGGGTTAGTSGATTEPPAPAPAPAPASH